jgi:hypothetical protein
MSGKGYDTETTQNEFAIKYVFVSKGKTDIVKAIEYRFVQDFRGRPLYNLGFGDYDVSTDQVFDNTNSNNGDAYPVFYTVLNTIPSFFEKYPAAMLMVQGSDSTPEFEANCRKSCRRKCIDTCKKLHQRIKTYREYVNKNFSSLNITYSFSGVLAENPTVIEDYEVGKKYVAVFLQRR